MTYFPQYLKTYPNMDSALPFSLRKNRLEHGYPAHRHDFLEFSFVVEGTGSESINGVLHPMKPGTFTFVLPYQVHELFTDPGSALVLYNGNFDMGLITEPGSRFAMSDLLADSESLPPYTYFEDKAAQDIRLIVEEMYREFHGDSRWRHVLIASKLKELLIAFDRDRCSKLTARPGSSSAAAAAGGGGSAAALPMQTGGPSDYPAAAPGSVWRIIHYIHTHYQDENLSLADLSRLFPLSPSRISELLKEATGQSFVPLLRDLRLRHACGLLASTEMTIAEIAHEVGFGSFKTFSRIFRESKGQLPSAYRKARINALKRH
ncbi:AraC-type DNA-binding protein [Paenibacillus sp. UNCCL117]|uniref:AraC family transcriptional regulator n=1 Tax=unclassified Paenibacillus TaxID=185978 RepID=UPI00087E8CE9|nr:MULTISPECIES: AraC family transcriptional regulator [unclassified Paenibacillus]SDC66381.1 AraC-type DNA-binding protein [Paenibacillus sp. cl123]SFW23023.1 AraC-type DNA-binding protein [Paenibacillus sp. UNCCL117]